MVKDYLNRPWRTLTRCNTTGQRRTLAAHETQTNSPNTCLRGFCTLIYINVLPQAWIPHPSKRGAPESWLAWAGLVPHQRLFLQPIVPVKAKVKKSKVHQKFLPPRLQCELSSGLGFPDERKKQGMVGFVAELIARHFGTRSHRLLQVGEVCFIWYTIPIWMR